MKPRAVKKIFAHLHLDELFAYLVSCLHGRDLLVGVETAPVSTEGKDLPKCSNPREWAAIEALCLGGGGDFSDEHINGQRARVENASATSLTIAYLGVQDPNIALIADEVHAWDNARAKDVRHRKTHLASILKMSKVQRPGGDAYAWKWAGQMVKAVYADLANPGLPAPKTSFEACMKQLLKRAQKKLDDADAFAGLSKILEGAATSGDLLGMKNIYEALWRTDMSPTTVAKKKAVFEHMMFLIEVLYRDQVSFHEFRRFAEALDTGVGNDTWFKVTIADGEGRGVLAKAAIVKTDNPQAHNALRSLGAIITIVVNGKGNVTVQGNQDWPGEDWLKAALDRGISDLCAMYRHGDMAADSCVGLTWDDLSMRGQCPSDPRWTLAEQGWLSIYNGTHNHAAVPTSLSLEQLRLRAQAAFCSSFLDEWRLEHLPAKPLKAPSRRKRRAPEGGHETDLNLGSRGVLIGTEKLFENPPGSEN